MNETCTQNFDELIVGFIGESLRERFVGSARNNSWPFSDQFSTFGRPKFILVGQIYCTFSMGW